MNLEAIASKLQLENVGKKGRSIFINSMPADAETGILLRIPFVGTEIDYELPNYRKTKFNVATRAKDYREAETLMRKVMACLTLSEVALENMDVRYIRPRTEPVPFPVTPAGQFEFLVIFDAVYVIVP